MNCHGPRSFRSAWTDDLSDAAYLGVWFSCALVFWEVVYQLSKSWLLKNYGQMAGDGGTGPQKKRRNKLRNQGPSHCCSIVHSTLMATGGAILFSVLQEGSPEDQYYKAIFPIHELNAAFLAFLVYDTAHVVGQFPELGGFDLLLHHAIFASLSFVNGGYGIFPHSFCWLILGDSSTILLGLRWLCIHTENAVGPWFDRLQYAFAVVFFSTRVLLYNWGLHHVLVKHFDVVRHQLPAPGFLVAGVVACLVAGGVLNLVWFLKIASLATKKGGPKKSD